MAERPGPVGVGFRDDGRANGGRSGACGRRRLPALRHALQLWRVVALFRASCFTRCSRPEDDAPERRDVVHNPWDPVGWTVVRRVTATRSARFSPLVTGFAMDMRGRMMMFRLAMRQVRFRLPLTLEERLSCGEGGLPFLRVDDACAASEDLSALVARDRHADGLRDTGSAGIRTTVRRKSCAVRPLTPARRQASTNFLR